jgi:hypothetical protein
MLSEDDWFAAVCESYLNPPAVVDGKELPGFPSDEIQVNTAGASGVNTLKEAFVFYRDCTETFRNLGAPIERQHRMLDFCVGWGRIARFFLRELHIENIYGIDAMEEFVQICTRTFRNNNFRVTKPFPQHRCLPKNSISLLVIQCFRIFRRTPALVG